MVFQCGLSDSKSPQVSRNILSILADLDDAVVLMVFTRPHISKSSSPCINPLVTVVRAVISCGIIVTYILHSFFFQSPSKVRVFILFSLSLNFTLWSVGTAKSTICKFFFFCCWLLLNLVVWPRLSDLFVSQNIKGYRRSHFPGHILGCAYTLCSYG